MPRTDYISKYHYITLDTQVSPKVTLRNIVEGETGNRVWITFTNKGEFVNLATKEDDAFIYRVVLRVDSSLGTRYQDSAVSGDGVTLIDDSGSGDYGKVNILLHPDVYAAGLNRCRLMIYSTQFTEHDRMIYSAEFQFTADEDDEEEVNVWRRGSTPTHSFEVGVNLTGGEVSVTYEQNGKVVVTKNTADMTITSSSVTWSLTAVDTLAMEVGAVYIQLHYTKNGVSDSSDIHTGKVLYTAGV